MSSYQLLSSFLAKQDIPAVERVILIVDRVMQRWWLSKVDKAVSYLMARLESYPALLGEQQVDVVLRSRSALKRELAVLMDALEERLGCPLPAEQAQIVEDAAEDLIFNGALAIGLPILQDSPRRRLVASRDLNLVIGGRMDRKAPEVRRVVRRFLMTREARQDVEAIRQEIRQLLGGEWQTWGPVTVDAWAYRWHNIGRWDAGREAGIVKWEAVNPRDEKTTPFCWWVHGKIVSISKVRAQLDRFYDAVSRGDSDAIKEAWPLEEALQPGGESRFRRVFGELGVPPYHFRCRTVLVPR